MAKSDISSFPIRKQYSGSVNGISSDQNIFLLEYDPNLELKFQPTRLRYLASLTLAKVVLSKLKV